MEVLESSGKVLGFFVSKTVVTLWLCLIVVYAVQ